MAVTLPVKTKEYIIVDVVDATLTLATLAGTSPLFHVKDPAGAFKFQDRAVSVISNMKLYCLIDTNEGGIWAAGDYKLYISFTVAPEAPRLGPFAFTVSDA